MSKKEIITFFNSQLESWPLAAANFSGLMSVRKKPFTIGSFNGYVQFNPARKGSTLAKVDKTEIEKRECFLCSKNRFEQQKGIEILPGWDLLVNPFPILPYHFTIVNKRHTPQIKDLETGKKLAELLEGFVVFYNDDGAGASAPDHMHFQAVPEDSLPLISLLNSKDETSLPFKVIFNEEEINQLDSPANIFFWKKNDSLTGNEISENKSENTEIKIVAIPRKSHRPSQFFLDPPKRRAFSPGALDMAGILVTPFEEDFEVVDDADILDIYNQTAFPEN